MEKRWTDEEIEKWVSELVRVQTLKEIAALPSNTEAVFVSHLDDKKIEALAKLKQEAVRNRWSSHRNRCWPVP
jgi:hypothetical protein